MENENSKLLHSELTETILGLYYDVYNESVTDSWNQFTETRCK